MFIKASEYEFRVVKEDVTDDGRDWMIFEIKVDKRKYKAFASEELAELIAKAKEGTEEISFYFVADYRLWKTRIIKDFTIVPEDDPQVATDKRLELIEAQIADLEEGGKTNE